MKESKIILSYCEENAEGFDPDSLGVIELDTPADAERFITGEMQQEAAAHDEKGYTTSGNIKDLYRHNEGSFSFQIGEHNTYHYRFKKTPGEYNVTDDEVVKALDAFCNSGRTQRQYKEVAERISLTMHRYIQNELWKFVKHLIRAFADGRYDPRNRTAHYQAQDIVCYMDGENM